MIRDRRAFTAAAIGCGLFVSGFGRGQAPAGPPAPAQGLAATTMQRLLLVDAARAGDRVVAVGDRGYIVLTDDDGATWRRARSPAAPLLTAVEFLDGRTGWAVGHDSVILGTSDGGENWAQQFAAPSEQRPLLDVLFLDAARGIAVGAYGAYYETADGGRSWTARKVLQDDRHMNAIVKVAENRLMIFGEAGTLLASADGGGSWSEVPSPYKGSLFGAVVAQDGAVVAFGLRGRIYRSIDGRAWTQVESGSGAALMGGSRLPDATLVIAGAAGTLLASRDHGKSFARIESGTTRTLSKVLPLRTGLLVLGEAGARRMPLPAGTP